MSFLSSPFARLLAVSALCSLIAACGPRAPGPHEHEWGDIFYWEVTGSELDVGHRCTDAPSFRDKLQGPEFEENTYLMYRVDTDGRSAVMQSCRTLDPATCEDSALDLVFEIDGQKLVAHPPPDVRDIENSACKLEGDEIWTVLDRGETMKLTYETTFQLVGDVTACAELEDRIVSQSSNGQGVNDCTLTLIVDGVFDRSSAP